MKAVYLQQEIPNLIETIRKFTDKIQADIDRNESARLEFVKERTKTWLDRFGFDERWDCIRYSVRDSHYQDKLDRMNKLICNLELANRTNAMYINIEDKELKIMSLYMEI